MRKLVVSNSMLRSLTTCSTQAWLRTNAYAAENGINAPARAGQDAHVAFEMWGRGQQVDVCVRAFLDRYKPFSDMYIDQQDRRNGRYHHENLARILEVFFATNPLPTLPYEIIETEKQIECKLGSWNDIEYVVSDKSDGLAQMKDTGDIWAVEYKTTQNIGPDYALDYELDSQITTHIEAWRQNGVDVKGVILQAVEFGKLPNPNAVTPKTGKPASCRVPGHGKVRDCWQQHVKQVRHMFAREPEHIQAWKNNVDELLTKYELLLMRGLEDAPQEGLFGRCGRCEFVRFCKGHRRNFDQLVKREREEGVLYSGLYDN